MTPKDDPWCTGEFYMTCKAHTSLSMNFEQHRRGDTRKEAELKKKRKKRKNIACVCE